jgi:hypothetical protein
VTRRAVTDKMFNRPVDSIIPMFQTYLIPQVRPYRLPCEVATDTALIALHGITPAAPREVKDPPKRLGRAGFRYPPRQSGLQEQARQALQVRSFRRMEAMVAGWIRVATHP